MTIYLVFESDYEGSFFHGAFSTQEKAQQYIESTDEITRKDLYIEEYELE